MLCEIPDDWTPTTANIEALPTPLRRFIMRLETHMDPAHTLQEVAALRDQVAELQAALAVTRAFGRKKGQISPQNPVRSED